MNDEKTKNLDMAISLIEKQHGKGSIMRLGNRDVLVPVSVIPSGSISIDAALDEAIEEICFRAAMERNSQQSVTPRQPGSLATLPSSREELPPAGPKLPKSGATAEAVTASKVQQGIERA